VSQSLDEFEDEFEPDHNACQEALGAALADRDRYAQEIVQIRASMREVAVYEGLVDTTPTAMLVSELVRDHEELEARIDAVVMLCRNRTGDPLAVEVVRLLQGGARTPDSPEALDP
jgi:hypothetical protein